MGFKGDFQEWEGLLWIGDLSTGAYRDPISDVRRIPAKAHPPGQAELAPAERITAWIRAQTL